MADVPDASRDRLAPVRAGEALLPEQALAAGLAALKAGDESQAIALLSSIDSTDAAPAVYLKAQAGLVRACQKNGQMQRAIALCLALQRSPQPAAQQWASKTLTELIDQLAAISPTPSLTSAQSDLAAGLSRARRSTPTTRPTRRSPSPQARKPTSRKPPASRPEPPRSIDPVESSSDRATRWGSLAPIKPYRLWGAIALTVGALLVVTLVIMKLLMLGFNLTVARITIPYIVIDLRRFAMHGSPLPPTLLLLGIMIVASSWLLPLLLRRFYGMTPYPLSDLDARSPEAVRLLKRAFAGRQRWTQMPTLGLLPTDAPVVFTVGVAPTVATLVLSQGALAQLTADELAALIAAEIDHLVRWDAAPLSVLMAIAQLGYLGYWRLAQLSDRLSNRIVQTLLNGLSSLCYGLFWLMRLIGVGLSRLRLDYSDRLALDLTGNPNGMIRALLKTTTGLAETCAHQGQIPPLLASFDLLLPVSLEQAITLGSLTPQPPEAQLLERDRLHSFGRWLWIRSSHLPLGVRLHRLTQVAHYWQLTPAYALGSPTAKPPTAKPPTPTRAASRTFLLQAAPFAGAAAGLAFGSMLGLFGAIALRLGWLQFDWLQQSSVFLGCGLIGFSLGTFLRINSFFPDITRNNLHSLPTDGQLEDWLSEPNTLPIHSVPVKLEGTLMGRLGHQTVLGQDLLLRLTNGALIKLHYVSRWGWQDAWWPRTPHPRALMQQSVTVVGWLRRGATPWIDVDQLYPKAGKRLVAGHPIWSTAIAGLTTLLGCWLFLTTR